MRRNPRRTSDLRSERTSPAIRLATLAILATLGLAAVSCSSASREYRFSQPEPGPGVVYVAEQVSGLEEWSRGPTSQTYARVYSRSGEADEGRLVRITADAVVLNSDDSRPATGEEVEIAKRDVLFMRVWW
jgi:hypothetical protein